MKQLLLFLMALILSSAAYSDEALEVKDFKISALTGNLVDSKTIAFELGFEKALEEVMMRLKSNNKQNKKDIIDCLNKVEKKSELVEKFTIKSERMTSKSYSAIIDLTFKKNVTSLLNKCGIDYGSFWGGQTLLLPIIIDDKNQLDLVDPNNNYTLYKALTKIEKNLGVLQVVKVIDKNIIEDYGIDLNSLVAGNQANTKELLQQLKGETMLIMLFQKSNGKETKISIKITNDNKFYNNSLDKLSLNKEEDYKVLIEKILTETDIMLKKGLKADKEPLFNSLVIFELHNPSDWQELRFILNRIPEIKEYRFKTISNDRIEIEMKYLINPTQLSNNLLKEGISLFKRNNQTIMKLK